MGDKITLKETADSVFSRYPKVNKVYVTTDGQAFFDEIFAKNHAVKGDLEIESFTRSLLPEIAGIDFDSMDRAGLEIFIKDNNLKVKFDDKTTDDNLLKAVRSVIAKSKKKD